MPSKTTSLSIIESFDGSSLGILDLEQFVRSLALERSHYQTAKQRVGVGWSGAEFWVRLGGNVIRVHFTWKFNKFNQLIVWRGSGEDQALFSDLGSVRVVYLVAVTVSFLNTLSSVNTSNYRARL
jgi:hypothetical protein